MKVLLTGATGYIGSAVADHLAAAGHQVVALTRTSAPQPERGWHGRLVGDTAAPASLEGLVTPDIDAVVHLAPPSGEAAVDAAVIEALAAPLRGTGRPFVYTSGIWVLGATGPDAVAEDAPVNPVPIVGYRPQIEQQVLAEATAGVRAVVVRPGIVYGRGGGIPAILTERARLRQAPEYVGEEPAVRWSLVHVDDLADLFVAVLDRAEAGTVWHGVAESAVPVRALAVAAGRAVGVVAAPVGLPVEEARETFGEAFADALALDQNVSGEAARTVLGWQPRRPGAVADLVAGSYRPVEVFGAEPGPARDAEVAAITALVAEVEHAQQNELPDRFMGVFRHQDPVWTTGHGKRLSGFEEIDAFTRKVLPGATLRGTAVYDVERILFLRPDVAAVNVRQQPVDPDGNRAEGPEGRPLYVLVKDDGTWRVGAAQNTQVVAD